MEFIEQLINGLNLGSIYALMALGYTMVYGIAKMLNFAHGDIIMVGAYTLSVAIATLKFPPALAIIVSMAVCSLLGITVEKIAYKPLRNASPLTVLITAIGVSYFLQSLALLIFGSNQRKVESVITNLDFLGGAGGLRGITKYKSTASAFTAVFVVLVLTVIIIRNLVKSRHGRAICSIRDNVIASESVGINVVFYKLLAFVTAAFFAGIAGVLYGHNLGILKPNTFDFNKSIEILVIVVLGGMGSITGSIISAIVITLLPEVLRGLEDYRLLIYAVVLIAMMLLNNNPKFNALKDTLKGKLLQLRPAKKASDSAEKEAD